MGGGGEGPSGTAGWLRRLEGVEQLGKPLRITQKQPSQHRLKSRGLPIVSRIAAPGPATGPVTATPHPIALAIAKQWIQAGEGLGLGSGPHLAHHGAVQILRAPGAMALPAPLVELPDGIPEPGQLEGGEVCRSLAGGHSGQPGGGGFRRRRGCQAPSQGRAEGAGTLRAAPV